MGLPREFCWTRFGTEAGENIHRIFQRKDLERRRNARTFLWGIGNSVANGIRALVTIDEAPHVIFSPIVSAPRPVDAKPSQVLLWTAGIALDGTPYEVPHAAVVTSRRTNGRQQSHYALVCESESTLAPTNAIDWIEFGALQNLHTSRPIGASQVTAVVRRNDVAIRTGRLYPAALKAKLVAPYFVKLVQFVVIDAGLHSAMIDGEDVVEELRSVRQNTSRTHFSSREDYRAL